ncbi:MAG: extracellular solute-binding protein [Fusicatenibacter sp.]
MKNKKLWAMTLASVMVLSTVLAGCGSDSKTSGTSSGNSSSEAEKTTGGEEGDSAESGDEKVNGLMYAEGLPIVDDGDYSFSLFVDGGDVKADDLFMFPILKEQTGVDVELQSYAYEIATEKYALALGSGDYADCIGGWCLSAKDVLTYGVDMGIFVPLDEYFDEYCPRINEILDLEGVRDTMTAPDGHIYSIPYVITAPLVDFNPYINTRWLENVGMEMPTTTEEFREVLRAFKEQDANGNGDPNDEIPLSGSPQNLHLGYMAGYFGCSISEEGFTMDGDQLVFGATSEAYKKGIEYLASLYAEGLIDPELFTQDSSTWKAKGGQDKYGVCIMYGSGDINPYEAGEIPDWAGLPVLKGDGVDNPVWLKNTYGTSVLKYQVVVTDAAEHPEIICRWWDNLMELDNSVMTQYGDEKVITKNDDGTYNKVDMSTLSEEDQKKYEWGNLWPQSLPKYIPADFKIKEAVETYDEGGIRDALYEPYLTEYCIPNTWPDLDHAEEAAELETSIKDYITQCQAKWIAGQSDINADWEGYLAQLDKLGLDRYLELKGAVKAE